MDTVSSQLSPAPIGIMRTLNLRRCITTWNATMKTMGLRRSRSRIGRNSAFQVLAKSMTWAHFKR